MRRMTRTEKLLAELIALPSVNPAFLPPRHPYAGEKRVADFIAAIAARAGLEIEFQKVLPGHSNVIARLRPKNKTRQIILLAPHLDTVGADGHVHVVNVRLGPQYGNDWIVESGLQAGASVITDNLQKLKDGVPVDPHPAGVVPPAPQAGPGGTDKR